MKVKSEKGSAESWDHLTSAKNQPTKHEALSQCHCTTMTSLFSLDARILQGWMRGQNYVMLYNGLKG